jgi:hypothetical protein
MRDYLRGMLVGFLGIVALCAACPKPGPAPIVNPPDAADAALKPAPSCSTACKHADAVCPGSLNPCSSGCNRIGATYARCAGGLAGGAGACHALDNCDPLNSLNDPSSAARQHGR